MTVKQPGRLDREASAGSPDSSDKAQEKEEAVCSDGAAEWAAMVREAAARAEAEHRRAIGALADAVGCGAYLPDPQKIAQAILREAELDACLRSLLRR